MAGHSKASADEITAIDATSDTPSDASLKGDARPTINRKVAKSPRLWSWFDENDGPEERKLVFKLDVYIMGFAFVGYWVMFLDRTVLQNAYVSGMKEELELFGNEFVNLNTFYNVGYTIAAIPATLLLTFVPAQRTVPTTMFLWGLFTLLCYQAKSYSQLAAFRFFVGLFEGPYFTSIQYIMGSWYRRDELVRRAGFFYVASAVGTMTSGLLAARIVKDLDGVAGHAGWRWLYIVAALITFPIAIWGFLAFPGTPNNKKRWMFTESEYAVARERMVAQGRVPPTGLGSNLKTVHRFVLKWHFWLLVPQTMIWYLTFMANSQGVYTLWLKSTYKKEVSKVNNYTAVNPGLGIIWTWAFSWLVDKYDDRARIPIFFFIFVVRFIANFGFVLYDKSSFAWKWFTIATGYMEVALSPIVYSYANIICAGDAEERAFILSSMLAFAYTCNIWVPLLTFRTVEAPKYPKGFKQQLIAHPIYLGWTLMLFFVARRGQRKRKAQTQVESDEREDSEAEAARS
ncbi:major facilitator superfamily domain-containing protein [Bisporella sp. PMI_857]|nr:major facilitator superfamily domain-containing protein [Bisporella sp. PMI_857]